MKKSYKESLSHTTWECKYHIVFALKFSKTGNIWKFKTGDRINNKRIMCKKRSGYIRSRSMQRSYTFIS